MKIAEAQRELRIRYAGGFHGQFVSGVLWLAAAALATWSTPRAAIATVILGGFLIFPLTELLIRLTGPARPLSDDNALSGLGMQVAFVLPVSMLLLIPVALYRLTWFFPALTILVGAHYIPFVFLYGMPSFAALAAALAGGGVLIALFAAPNFSLAAWYTALVLLAFAGVGRAVVQRELGEDST